MASKLTQTIDELIEDTNAKPQPPKGPFKAKVINPMTSGNEHLRETDEGETVTRTQGTKVQGVTGKRIVEIADRQFTLLRRDPYGFWYVQAESGKTPKALSGTYTSAAEAERAITIYVNKNKG